MLRCKNMFPRRVDALHCFEISGKIPRNACECCCQSHHFASCEICVFLRLFQTPPGHRICRVSDSPLKNWSRHVLVMRNNTILHFYGNKLKFRIFSEATQTALQTCPQMKKPPGRASRRGRSAGYVTSLNAGFGSPQSAGCSFRRTRRLAGFLSEAAGTVVANAPMKAALATTSTATTVQIGISRPIVTGASPVTQDRVSAIASAAAGRPAFSTTPAAWMPLRISTRSQKSREAPFDRWEVHPAVSSQRDDFCATWRSDISRSRFALAR
jgi:hypothetical protein